MISVYNEATNTWGGWVNIGTVIVDASGWSLKDIDITAYAGKRVRLGFYHTASCYWSNCSDTSTGWFIDDIEIVAKVPEFTGDFEMGWGDWGAHRGVWMVGEAPGGCRSGTQCAATGFYGNYPGATDSLFSSATIQLPALAEGEELHLRFWNRFSYSTSDSGQVMISVYNEATNTWGGWEKIREVSGSSNWSPIGVPITPYAGKKVQLGFYHTASCYWSNCSDTSTGWVIDDIELVGMMPTIDAIAYARYIPEPCTSLIDVYGTDPLGGELTYLWELLDGGTLNGAGASREFIPPEIRLEPYRVQVAVSSKTTHLTSFVKTLHIFTQVLYDLDADRDIDGADLGAFIRGVQINATSVGRFAEEFGAVACAR
jgi:hypothetical protein